jgi:hypothetical protein
MFAATARQCSKLQHNTAVRNFKKATAGEHLAPAAARSVNSVLCSVAADQQ